MNHSALKVVPRAEPTQFDLTQELADAMIEQDEAEAALRASNARVDAAFRAWAAGRSTSRDQARAQLVATGFIPRKSK